MRTAQLSFAFLSTFTLANAAAAYPPGLYKRAAPQTTLAHGYVYQGCYVYESPPLTRDPGANAN